MRNGGFPKNNVASDAPKDTRPVSSADQEINAALNALKQEMLDNNGALPSAGNSSPPASEKSQEKVLHSCTTFRRVSYNGKSRVEGESELYTVRDIFKRCNTSNPLECIMGIADKKPSKVL